MIKIQSTSQNSAMGEPIVLRQTTKSRLIFLPEIVNNLQHPDCCVKGSFIYQVKLPSGTWTDYKTLDLNKLKKDDWVKISIKTEELKTLITSLDKYYNIYEKYGIQKGVNEFILTDDNIKLLLDQILDKKVNFLKIIEKGGPEILEKLLTWLSVTSDTELVINKLQNLKIDNLNKINSLIGVSNIKKLMEHWESNKENSDEEFWQTTFTKHAWILSQIFSHPVVILNDKAFVGGKAITNKGGKVIDFLYQNKITTNVILIEIKTPLTKLLGKEYRSVYSISEELTGSVNQILNYREELQKNYFNLRDQSNTDFVLFNPKCLIIAGSIKTEIDDKTKSKSFEVFRNDIRNVEIISFDELQEKISLMLSILESNK